MNWSALAFKLPGLISGAVAIVNHIKGSGKEKERAVLESIPSALALTEFAVDKDLVNDAEFLEAAKTFIAAEVALKNLITKKTRAT